MNKLILMLALSLGLVAQEKDKKPEPPKPTVVDLQKQIDELKSQLDIANKLLQSYYNKWISCDAQLTRIQATAPKPKEDEKK